MECHKTVKMTSILVSLQQIDRELSSSQKEQNEEVPVRYKLNLKIKPT